MKINARPLFYADIAEEVAYLAEKAGPRIAVCWADSVWTTIEHLKKFPELGRLRPDIPFPAIRSWRVDDFGRWLIFYAVRDRTLIFYRVRHGAVNLLRVDFNS
jgi:toxin ParE1/3/4